MRTLFLALLLALAPIFSYAQETYSKATVRLNGPGDYRRLAALGLEVDHGEFGKQGFTNVFSATEIRKIQAAGFQVDVVVADMAADYVARNRRPGSVAAPADNFPDPDGDKLGSYPIPRHWHYGHMGGHLTYEEALAQLDSMHLLYPNLITARAPIDTIKTFENRSIYWLRLSKNAATPNPNQPAVLFNAVHHAREPVGLHQLIWFMWDLLERYGTDPELTKLIDNTQIYFVPIVNPDGYKYNQTTNPDGGGFWRKNRRNNRNGTFGVDPNRNYGNHWGEDDIGSSPDGSSETYRGAQPFSEPESRAIRYLARQYKFRSVINYHTYGNVFIYPYGYADIETPEAFTFRHLAEESTKESHFAYGTCNQVLFYVSNGAAEDYHYLTEANKPRAYSFTPEVGPSFWPTQDEIVPLCQRTQYQNRAVLRSVHPFGVFRDSTGLFLRPGFGANAGPQRIRYKLRHIGTGSRGAAGAFRVTFRPIGSGHSSADSIQRTYASIPQDSEIMDSVFIAEPRPGTFVGNRLGWQVAVSNGIFTILDTIYHYDGVPQSSESLHDACDSRTGWTGSWVVDNVRKAEGTGCLSDSPGLYTRGADSVTHPMTRNTAFNLSSASWAAAELSMMTRYDIFRFLDVGTVLLSQDEGQSWTISHSDQTHQSSYKHGQGYCLGLFQDLDDYQWVSVRDGSKPTWSRESIDLQPYIGGGDLYLRLLLGTDELFFVNSEARDGMFVDDIRIRYVTRTLVGAKPLVSASTLTVQPNPSAGWVTVEASGREPIQVLDPMGRTVLSREAAPSLMLDLSALPKGIYTLRQGAQAVRIVRE